MDSKLTTEALLHRDLQDLYRVVLSATEMNLSQNETQQRIDEVEMRWTELLERERGLRLDQARHDAQYAAEQQELDASRRDRVLQDRAMAELAERNPRQPIFHVSRSSESLDPALEGQRAEVAAQFLSPIEDQIKERYDGLRSGLQEAVDTISQGKSPDLRFLLQKQMEQEARLANALEKLQEREREEGRER